MPSHTMICENSSTTALDIQASHGLGDVLAHDGREESQPRPLTESQLRTTQTLIVLASFGLTFTGCGLNFAFGVYQRLYESLPFLHASPAAIDLIGTLAVSIMSLGAPFASAWTKAFDPRTVTLVGGAILGIANVLASFGQSLWHLLLTQGVLLGVGTCLSYIPAVTIAPGWFDQRRGAAMGCILAGTGVGGVCWAPILRLLNEKIGFRNTLRLTGGVGWLLISSAALVLKWDPKSEQRNRVERQSMSKRKSFFQIPLVNWKVAKTRKFTAHAAGAVLQAAAYYVPVYYFSAYASTLGFSTSAGANFISASNASSACGKIVLGWVADAMGRLNTLTICTIISAGTALGLWFPSTLIGDTEVGKSLFVAFAITYGIAAGAYVSLFPTSLVELFGVENFASVNGFLYMLRGIGSMVGTPSAGALIRSAANTPAMGMKASSGYERPSIMIGVLLGAAAMSVFWARIEAVGIRQLKA